MNLKECAELLKAIAHPIRLQLLAELKNGTRCVNDIRELLDVSQPNLSQHLSILRKERIIDFKQDGKKRCYFIVNKNVAAALRMLMKQ